MPAVPFISDVCLCVCVVHEFPKMFHLFALLSPFLLRLISLLSLCSLSLRF